jgi:hypothetical protein
MGGILREDRVRMREWCMMEGRWRKDREKVEGRCS